MTTIRCNVADAQKKLQYDISGAVISATYSTYLTNQPGKLVVTVADSKRIDFPNGSVITFKVDGFKMFKGYVFSVKKRPYESTITCYDKIRYLGSADSVVMSSTSIRKVADLVSKRTRVKITHPAGGKRSLGKKVFDSQSYYQMLMWAFDKDLRKTKKMHILRDEYGTVRIRDVSKLMKQIVIGDYSLMMEYEYLTSIDDETYTSVKLIRDRSIKDQKDKVKRSTLTLNDDADIKRYGKLQYFERVDDKMKNAAMKKMAKNLLSVYSKPTKSLDISCIGFAPLRAGDGIGIRISDLNNEGFAKIKMAYCSSVTHEISHELHTMDLEVVVQ